MARQTLAALLCSAALVGCEGATEPLADPVRVHFQTGAAQQGNPLLGSWALTDAAGTDVTEIPKDFSLILTFWDDGTYSLAATNTSDNFVCQDVTSCTIYGTYEYTATLITLTPEEGPFPEPGPDTGLYALCGGRLIYMDSADDGGVRLTFVRTRRDCYVSDCG